MKKSVQKNYSEYQNDRSSVELKDISLKVLICSRARVVRRSSARIFLVHSFSAKNSHSIDEFDVPNSLYFLNLNQQSVNRRFNQLPFSLIFQRIFAD